jgi:ketosteroid isomerase-like protein
MKTVSLAAALALALIALPASAEQKHAHHAPAAATATDTALKEPIAVVERFSAALKAGDFDTVRTLLDEKVVILESGGAERSREEYLGHHAISDAAFLGGATVSDVKRGGAVRGDLAWVASESRIQSGQGGEAKTLLSTETMVLERGADGWRIVHIHWSSRPKR